jgi:hypothetical protein
MHPTSWFKRGADWARIEYEAKLAVAVEALEGIRWSWENDAGRQCDNLAHEALAKIKTITGENE